MSDSSVWTRLLTETWPARMANSALTALMAPGNAYKSTPDNPVTTEQMIKPSADLAGLIMGGSYAKPAMQDAAGMGIRAYHGSPHDFDRFDLSKIGTGEGAQAYGHGLYFAESEPVARSYRDTLEGRGFKLPSDVLALPEEQQRAILQAANAHGAQPDPMQAAKRAQWASPDLRSQPLESIADKIVRSRPPPGRMYEVNINAHPDQFLDWDKPLAMDSPVRDMISDNARRWLETTEYGRQRSIAKDNILAAQNENLNGHGAYRSLASTLNKPGVFPEISIPQPSRATDALREAGIPGIKYLDQGSRAAGDGSRNYVVFDDKLIDILKKYGLAGLSASPLAQLMIPPEGAQRQ